MISKVISAEEARSQILAQVRPLDPETVPLSEGLGRYLASPITAPIDLPPFDNSAMDGHAIASVDSQEASSTEPTRLRVVGIIAAGTIRTASPLTVGRGEAVRIMTGAMIPSGADTVVPLEETRAGVEDEVLVLHPSPAGTNIRRKGEDIQRGQVALEKGEQLTSRAIALVAALGIDRVSVARRPSVALLVTGTELVEPGQPLAAGQIYNSNGPALTAALREIGIDRLTLLTGTDRAEELRSRISEGLKSDVLITVGGVSAGDFDLVPKVLARMGAKTIFHKVAIKPGKPLLFATWEGKPIFGLPGNPVSALMVFDRFIRPALLKMIGVREVLRPRRTATAKERLKGSEGKEDYLRGIVTFEEGRLTARSAGRQGSAHLVPLARANATLVIPAGRSEIGAGEAVEVEIWEEI